MNKLLTKQIELFLRKEYVHIFPHTEDVSESIERIKRYADTKGEFLIYIHHEIIPFQEYFDKIINLVQSLPNNIWIMSSTASTHPNMVNPLVNVLMYKSSTLPNDIISKDEYVPHFSNKLLTRSIENKTIHSILSMNRKTDWRDIIYDNIKDCVISIKRYVGGDTNISYPKWTSLTEEYLRTYIACVIETNYPTETTFTCFTEKTILAFLCRNIPLVLGKRGLVDELESMGFWISNKELGFDDNDSNIDSYIKCIDKLNKIDIVEYYLDNLENINNNHKIISEIYSKKLTKRLV